MFTVGLQGCVVSSWVIGSIAEFISLKSAFFALALFAPLVLLCAFVRTDTGTFNR
jgi:hypothetical protein